MLDIIKTLASMAIVVPMVVTTVKSFRREK